MARVVRRRRVPCSDYTNRNISQATHESQQGKRQWVVVKKEVAGAAHQTTKRLKCFTTIYFPCVLQVMTSCMCQKFLRHVQLSVSDPRLLFRKAFHCSSTYSCSCLFVKKNVMPVFTRQFLHEVSLLAKSFECASDAKIMFECVKNSLSCCQGHKVISTNFHSKWNCCFSLLLGNLTEKKRIKRLLRQLQTANNSPHISWMKWVLGDKNKYNMNETCQATAVKCRMQFWKADKFSAGLGASSCIRWINLQRT